MPYNWQAVTLEGTDPVRCGCGRTTTPDMMVVVDDLEPALLDTLLVAVVNERRAVCDACRERIFAAGKIERAEFYRQLGAPAPARERIAAGTARRRAARGQL